MVWRRLALVTCLALLCGTAAGEERVLRLHDFETPDELDDWQFNSGTGRLVTEGATHGSRALELTFDPQGRYNAGYLYWKRVRRDWSGFSALVIDVYNPSDEPLAGYLLVADDAWRRNGGTYWNRHNGRTTFAPGRTRWTIPVSGLYRGEAGSRNNDVPRNIDPDSIVRVDLGFGRPGRSGRVILDNMRLVRADRPEGVWAFDFGPPGQAAMLGWTPVSHETRYTPQSGHGWGPQGGTPWNGAARDTTFGPMLLRDFCEAGGYRFRVDVPAGRYEVLGFYENAGYWGGEQARQTERRILAQGRLVWQEKRPDGSRHPLYRFEQTEPVGRDIWETYMEGELVRPVRFEVQVDRDGLELRFEADRAWGSKLAGLAVVREGEARAQAWLRDQLAAVEEEFRSAAVCLDEPAPSLDAPEDADLLAWPVRIEDTITPNSVPPGEEAVPSRVSRLAVCGEYEPFCIAVRPLRDLGECRLHLEPFEGPGTLEATLRVVWYNTSRGFNSIAYRIRPHTLREQETMDLPADLTREFIVTVRAPADAPPGDYRGAFVLRDRGGAELLRVPLRLTVSGVVLDRETDLLMGFYGLMPPLIEDEARRWRVLEETLVMLREHGMNAVSGGPNWRLAGWRDGQPVIDFDDMDRFFALLRRHGFTRPLNGYGGARFLGLHQRWAYEKGDTGREVERQSGLPYPEAVMRAWRAVDEHARANDWPTILYAMCDETRVREKAVRELEFMRLMGRVSRTFPRTLRTSGSYSVSFRERPTNPEDLAYWHQRFFRELDISCLNRHDESVMAEARRLDKEVQIYNQGRTRYTFGLYQWSEQRKGVRARWQWHLNVLYGYQFFDLDAREPDNAMLCYGREALYPTIHFERCREGAEDFYLYSTLAKLAERGGDEAATKLVAELEGSVALNQRTPPDGYDADALKARVVEAIEGLQMD